MRTRAALTGAFASLGILVAAWQFGVASLDAAHTGSTATAAPTGSQPAPSAAPGTAAPVAPVAPAAGAKDGTYTGSSVGTPYGNVQVTVTITGGKIAEVTPIRLTDRGGRSIQIDNYSVPILRSSVLKSQSAKVSGVSGATYTSGAYLTSVQAALDAGGF